MIPKKAYETWQFGLRALMSEDEHAIQIGDQVQYEK